MTAELEALACQERTTYSAGPDKVLVTSVCIEPTSRGTHQQPNLDLGGNRVLETPATYLEVNEALWLEAGAGDAFRFLGAMVGKYSRLGRER